MWNSEYAELESDGYWKFVEYNSQYVARGNYLRNVVHRPMFEVLDDDCSTACRYCYLGGN